MICVFVRISNVTAFYGVRQAHPEMEGDTPITLTEANLKWGHQRTPPLQKGFNILDNFITTGPPGARE